MFKLIKNGNLSYYKIDSFENTGLVNHCFTTKLGGVSKNEYESLNLRMNCDDSKENILKNFEIISSAIGVDCKNLVFSNQVHDDKIEIVTSADLGNGISQPNKFESADGIITNEAKVPLVTFYADCVPLYFLDVKNKVIALSHSGWKGTIKNIAGKTIKKMVDNFNSSPSDILCAIGPSIGECHFEVGEEVFKIFENYELGVTTKHNQKLFVNLQKTIENQMLASGISKQNIEVANICTYCNEDMLFSHRKTNGRRGSLAAIMELRK